MIFPFCWKSAIFSNIDYGGWGIRDVAQVTQVSRLLLAGKQEFLFLCMRSINIVFVITGVDCYVFRWLNVRDYLENGTCVIKSSPKFSSLFSVVGHTPDKTVVFLTYHVSNGNISPPMPRVFTIVYL